MKRISVFVVLMVLLVSATLLANDTPRIAVISAFGAELTVLKAQAEIEEVFMLNGRSYTTGVLRGHDVVMFETGVSMVNAAMNTQLLLDNFNVTHIVFSGIAGGVNPDLNIGDVTVPAQWAQYQEAFFAKDTDDGWDVGWHETPFPNFDMSFPQTVDVARDGLGEVDAEEEMFWFSVDPDMLAVAYEIIDDVELLSEVGEAKLENIPKLVVGGNGVSGQTFVNNAEYRDYVFVTFSADALDMETSAVAHVAYANEVPYIAFRSLSDLAGGGPGMNQVRTFFGVAALNAAEVLIEWLEAWD